jgi:L-lactate permease
MAAAPVAPGGDSSKAYVGPWGKAVDVIMCLIPIAFLILVTVVKRIHLKTSLSLPLSAFIFYVIRLAYFGLDPHFTHGAVLYGLFDALTPLSILTGAIILFQTMEQTKVCSIGIVTSVTQVLQGFLSGNCHSHCMLA